MRVHRASDATTAGAKKRGVPKRCERKLSAGKENWRTLGLAFGRQAPQMSGGSHVQPMRRRPALNFAASLWDLSFFAPTVVASLARCNRIALSPAPRRMRKIDRCRDPHEIFNGLLLGAIMLLC